VPSRRRLLALASTTAIAGCLGDAGTSRSPDETGDDAPNATNGTDGSSNDPPQLGSPKSGSCPSHEERVVCYDEVDPTTTPMVLSPDTRSIEPDETIAFTLENGTDTEVKSNFYDWTLEKRVDGEWFRIAPAAVPEPLMTLRPGESHTWHLTIENGGVEKGDTVPTVQGDREFTVRGLGGGTYGFSVDGWFGQDVDTKTAFAATFDLDADPLALTPTNDVAETERDGETLIVRADRSDGDESRENASLDGDPVSARRLDRVDDADRRLVVEQVVRYQALRDALSYADRTDAESIRVEEYGEGSTSYRFDATVPFVFRDYGYAFTDDLVER